MLHSLTPETFVCLESGTNQIADGADSIDRLYSLSPLVYVPSALVVLAANDKFALWLLELHVPAVLMYEYSALSALDDVGPEAGHQF